MGVIVMTVCGVTEADEVVRAVIVRPRRGARADNALDRFAAIQPVTKRLAAVLAAEPELLTLVLDCPRRRFVDLHVTDGINGHVVPRELVGYLKSMSSSCGSSSKRRRPNNCRKRGDVRYVPSLSRQLSPRSSTINSRCSSCRK